MIFSGRASPAAGAAVALAAALGTAWGLHATQSVQHRAVPRTSAVAAAVDPGLADVVPTLGYQDATSAGTGLVLTARGEVLTNNHVIEGATSVKVTDVATAVHTGRRWSATTGAPISAWCSCRGSGLKTVTLGNSSRVTVGERVIALGKGGTPAVATGRVTGPNESITATDEAAGTAEQLTGLIRTNAALQAGDSGGPLVTTNGRCRLGCTRQMVRKIEQPARVVCSVPKLLGNHCLSTLVRHGVMASWSR